MADKDLRFDLAKLIVEALGIGTGKHETGVIREIFVSLNNTFPDNDTRIPADLLHGAKPDPEQVVRALAAAAPTAEVLLNELVRVSGRFMDMVQEVYARLARHTVSIGGTEAAEKFRFQRGGIDEEQLTISPAFIEQWRHVCQAVQRVELGLIDEEALYSFLAWDISTFYGGRIKTVAWDQLPAWVLAFNQTGDVDQAAAEQLISAAERVVRARIARLREQDGDTEAEEDGQAARYREFLRPDRAFFQETGLIGMRVDGDVIAGDGVQGGNEALVIGLDADMSPVLRPAGDAGYRSTPTAVGELAGFIAMSRLGLVPAGRNQPVPARDLPADQAERTAWLKGYKAACDRAARWMTDEVFTPTGTAEVTGLTEKIEEFLNLPLWRRRELLYEIWVLCATLDACEQAEWNVDEIPLSRDGDEWVLQVGRSKSPVATLRHSKQQSMTLDVWREPARKAMGREVTPDVTVSTRAPYAVDLLVVEAKDRARMPSGLIRDAAGTESAAQRTALAVARRYAGTVRPRAVWVCNHCDYTQPARGELNHGTEWTQIRLADQFRPRHVPDVFAESVRSSLALPPGLVPEASPARGLVLVLDVTARKRPRLEDVVNKLNGASALQSYGQFRVVLYSDHRDCEPLLVRKAGPFGDLASLRAAIDPLPAGHRHDDDQALEDALQRCRELVDDIGPQDLLILTDANPHPASACPYGIDWESEIRSLLEAGCRILIASDSWTGESHWNAFTDQAAFSFAPLEDLLGALPPG